MADYFSSQTFLEQFEELFHPDDPYEINEITIDHLKGVFEANRITHESSPADITSAIRALLNYVKYATNETSNWGSTFHPCLDMMIQFNQLEDLDGSIIYYVVFPYQFCENGAPDKEVLLPYFVKFSTDLANRINRESIKK